MPSFFKPAANGQSALPVGGSAQKPNFWQQTRQRLQQTPFHQRLQSLRQKLAMMEKGGPVKKAFKKGDKFKKPIKKKSFKQKRMAFKEGGAVERFLQKYPDYNPES